MTDEELRLECIIVASKLMAKKPICIFNKETYRILENPICVADVLMQYIKTGSLVYLNKEELTLRAEPTSWEYTIKQLEKENADLRERLKRKGFLKFRR